MRIAKGVPVDILNSFEYNYEIVNEEVLTIRIWS
jgi:hypothetical protein